MSKKLRPNGQKRPSDHNGKKPPIQHCVHTEKHACQCRHANCYLKSHRMMKCVSAHTKVCNRKTKGHCPLCKCTGKHCTIYKKCCQTVNTLPLPRSKIKCEFPEPAATNSANNPGAGSSGVQALRQPKMSGSTRVQTISTETFQILSEIQAEVTKIQQEYINCNQVNPREGAESRQDSEKMKLVQLICHAQKCQRVETLVNEQVWSCTLPQCKKMKKVLNHMMTCRAGENCSVTDCSSSRRVISHWEQCVQNNCPTCLPMKQAAKNRNNPNAVATALRSTHSRNPSKSRMRLPCDPLGVRLEQGSTSQNTEQSTLSLDLSTSDKMLACNPLGLGPKQVFTPASMLQTTGLPSSSIRLPTAGGPNVLNSAGIGAVRVLSPMQGQAAPNVSLPLESYLTPACAQNTVARATPVPQQNTQLFGVPTEADARATQALVGSDEHTQLSTGLRLGQVTASPVLGTKDWHQYVTPDLRNVFAQLLVQPIFDSSDPQAVLENCFHNLVTHVCKVEADVYKMANSQEEYYQLAKRKVHVLLKGLNMSRNKRRKRKQQRQSIVTVTRRGVLGTVTEPPPGLRSNAAGLSGLTIGSEINQENVTLPIQSTQEPTPSTAAASFGSEPANLTVTGVGCLSQVQTAGPFLAQPKPCAVQSSEPPLAQPQPGAPSGNQSAPDIPRQNDSRGRTNPLSVTKEMRSIRKLLLYLLHTRACQQEYGNVWKCPLLKCRKMKNLLNHTVACHAGRSCTYPSCRRYHRAIFHWDRCRQSDCALCAPVRRIFKKKNRTCAATSPQGERSINLSASDADQVSITLNLNPEQRVTPSVTVRLTPDQSGNSPLRASQLAQQAGGTQTQCGCPSTIFIGRHGLVSQTAEGGHGTSRIQPQSDVSRSQHSRQTSTQNQCQRPRAAPSSVTSSQTPSKNGYKTNITSTQSQRQKSSLNGCQAQCHLQRSTQNGSQAYVTSTQPCRQKPTQNGCITSPMSIESTRRVPQTTSQPRPQRSIPNGRQATTAAPTNITSTQCCPRRTTQNGCQIYITSTNPHPSRSKQNRYQRSAAPSLGVTPTLNYCQRPSVPSTVITSTQSRQQTSTHDKCQTAAVPSADVTLTQPYPQITSQKGYQKPPVSSTQLCSQMSTQNCCQKRTAQSASVTSMQCHPQNECQNQLTPTMAITGAHSTQTVNSAASNVKLSYNVLNLGSDQEATFTNTVTVASSVQADRSSPTKKLNEIKQEDLSMVIKQEVDDAMFIPQMVEQIKQEDISRNIKEEGDDNISVLGNFSQLNQGNILVGFKQMQNTPIAEKLDLTNQGITVEIKDDDDISVVGNFSQLSKENLSTDVKQEGGDTLVTGKLVQTNQDMIIEIKEEDELQIKTEPSTLSSMTDIMFPEPETRSMNMMIPSTVDKQESIDTSASQDAQTMFPPIPDVKQVVDAFRQWLEQEITRVDTVTVAADQNCGISSSQLLDKATLVADETCEGNTSKDVSQNDFDVSDGHMEIEEQSVKLKIEKKDDKEMETSDFVATSASQSTQTGMNEDVDSFIQWLDQEKMYVVTKTTATTDQSCAISLPPQLDKGTLENNEACEGNITTAGGQKNSHILNGRMETEEQSATSTSQSIQTNTSPDMNEVDSFIQWLNQEKTYVDAKTTATTYQSCHISSPPQLANVLLEKDKTNAGNTSTDIGQKDVEVSDGHMETDEQSGMSENKKKEDDDMPKNDNGVQSGQWHQSVTPDLRNNLVQRLIQATFPTQSPQEILRIHQLVVQLQKTETSMYEKANSRLEYNHLLAKKIYMIEKGLNDAQ